MKSWTLTAKRETDVPDIKGPPPDRAKVKDLLEPEVTSNMPIAEAPITYLDTVEAFTKCFGQLSNAETIHTDIYHAMECSGILRRVDSTYNNTVEAAEPNAGEVIASFLESLKGIRRIPEPRVRYDPLDQSFWVDILAPQATSSVVMDVTLPIIGNEPSGK